MQKFRRKFRAEPGGPGKFRGEPGRTGEKTGENRGAVIKPFLLAGHQNFGMVGHLGVNFCIQAFDGPKTHKNGLTRVCFQEEFCSFKRRRKSAQEIEKLNIQELENKNFENMIFKKKLVPLLLDRHFALATSFQLNGTKHGRSLEKLQLRSSSTR